MRIGRRCCQLWLVMAGGTGLLAGGTGCRTPASAPRPDAARRVVPARVYASYRFDRSPSVLSFGIQPLWIPACVIWEVMSRDPKLPDDLRRARCRLEAFAFFKGRDLNAYLGTGQLQGGIGGDLPALKAATESSVRIVSLIQQGPCSIVAREGLTLEKLRGRHVGYAPGSNAHYTLLRTLREHGLRPTDVRLVPMDMTEMSEALASGRIDAFSAWEPTPTLALVDHPSFDVLARTDARGYIYFRRDFFERQPAVVRAIVAAEARALRWLRRNDRNTYVASRWARDRAVAFAGTELPLTVYDFHRLSRRDLLRVPTAPRLMPELLSRDGAVHQQFRLAQEYGLISADASWERLRESFAMDVVPESQHEARSTEREAGWRRDVLPHPLLRAPGSVLRAGAKRL
jgi:sulfonate transport system substrate-binding protein